MVMANYFDNIEITNYRGFDHLMLNDLRKVNVFVGANNVGKTTILESVFMLLGMFNPLMPTKVNYWRMMVDNGLNEAKYLFHNMNFNCCPIFSAKTPNGIRQLMITPTMKDYAGNVMSGNGMNENEISKLDFDFSDDYNGSYKYKSTLYMGKDGSLQNMVDEEYSEKLRCLFLSSDKNDKNAVANFAAIVRRGKKHIVSDIIKEFDPKIESLEALPDGIYLKLENTKELLPMTMSGDGIRRMVNLISSVANEDNNVVMIDEIDAGLHFSAHRLMWKSILNFVEAFDVQLFVTTHNLDCVQGLKCALDNDAKSRDDVAVYNVAYTSKDGFKSYRYSYDGLKTAVENEIEIRR